MENLITETIMPLLHALLTLIIPLAIAYGTKLVKDKIGIELQAGQVGWLNEKAIFTVKAVEARAERKLIDLSEKLTIFGLNKF